MIPVLAWELSRRKMFTLWWTLGISLLIGVTVLLYGSLGSQSKELNSTFKDLTNSSGTFFGGTDFFSPIGYLSSQIYYITLPVVLIIMVTTLVSSLMNRDENDATIELTLARPISRTKLLVAKALTGLAIVAVVAAVTYVVTAISVNISGMKIDQSDVLLTHLLSFGFSLTFGVISFALMALSQMTRKVATVVAIVIYFGSYMLSSLAGMIDWLKTPAKLMPYHYYDTAALLAGKLDKGLIIYIVGVVVLGAVVAVVGYSRRDIG